MRYLKTYENLNKNYPDIGDYVLLYVGNYIESIDYDIYDFLNNNIGKVANYIFDDLNKLHSVNIKYDNIPLHLKEYFMFNEKIITLNFISCFGKTIEDVKICQQSKKYNL